MPRILDSYKCLYLVFARLTCESGACFLNVMKKVSKKQAHINAELAKIKSSLTKRCVICGREGNDLSHILPKSLYPEYQTDPRNLQILCRECHRRFDDDRSFRRKQTKIVEQAKEIDELAAYRYFGL